MTNREAIEVFNKWIDCKDAYQADPSCDGRCHSCEYYTSAGEEREAMLMAISALEKQEQTNAQSVNSMRTSRPNALESLNILEQAKDDKGCVPMSLVRQAFRNVIEQDRWIPVTERLPEDEYVLISKKPSKLSGSKWSVAIAIRTADPRSRKIQWRDSGFGVIQDDKVLAWRPLPEPYTEEES